LSNPLEVKAHKGHFFYNVFGFDSPQTRIITDFKKAQTVFQWEKFLQARQKLQIAKAVKKKVPSSGVQYRRQREKG
jgi:hypothetical protein